MDGFYPDYWVYRFTYPSSSSSCIFLYPYVDCKVFLGTWKDIPAANEVQNQITDVNYSSNRRGWQRER